MSVTTGPLCGWLRSLRKGIIATECPLNQPKCSFLRTNRESGNFSKRESPRDDSSLSDVGQVRFGSQVPFPLPALNVCSTPEGGHRTQVSFCRDAAGCPEWNSAVRVLLRLRWKLAPLSRTPYLKMERMPDLCLQMM